MELGEISTWVLVQPDTIKAAMLTAFVGIAALLVNSVVSILGTVVNNMVTLRKMRTDLRHDRDKTALQLQHDRDQKERDRSIAMRREIFLGLAEAVDNHIDGIWAFSDLNLKYAEIIARIHAADKFTAQLHVVGSSELVRQSVLAIRAARRGHTQVRLKRVAVEQVLRNRDSVWQVAQHCRKQESTLIAQATDFQMMNPPDANQANSRQKMASFYSKRAVEHENKHIELEVEVARLHVDLVEAARIQEQAVLPVLIPLIRAVREELGLPFDESVYRELVNLPPISTREDLEVLLGVNKGAPLIAPLPSGEVSV